jgi:hypothetical protein
VDGSRRLLKLAWDEIWGEMECLLAGGGSLSAGDSTCIEVIVNTLPQSFWKNLYCGRVKYDGFGDGFIPKKAFVYLFNHEFSEL